MATISEECRAVKRALVATDHKCHVRKGNGSARCWIYVEITDRLYTNEEQREIEDLIVRASGRRDIFDSISVGYTFRPVVPGTCSDCGASGSDLNRVLCADDIIRTYCRLCGGTVAEPLNKPRNNVIFSWTHRSVKISEEVI